MWPLSRFSQWDEVEAVNGVDLCGVHIPVSWHFDRPHELLLSRWVDDRSERDWLDPSSTFWRGLSPFDRQHRGINHRRIDEMMRGAGEDGWIPEIPLGKA